MHEFEPKPRYDFPWCEDQYGEYLRFRVSDDQTFEVRQETAVMFLFPDHPDIDHIFIATGMSDDGVTGYPLFRGDLDNAVGEGAFSALCDDLFERGFSLAPDEEPSDSDIALWEQRFGREYIRPNPIDKIVELALRNFDDAWRYYSEEWSA